VKKIANCSVDDRDQTGSDEADLAIRRLMIDEDFLFITFAKAPKGDPNSRGEYRIHSPANNEIIKVLLQQPLISRMWLLEIDHKDPEGMIYCSAVEKIQRCRAASAPDQLRLIFTIKEKEWYFECDVSEPPEHLEPVYTLAQFY
jgi:hypothetical protein